MKGLFHNIAFSFSQVWHKHEGLSIRNMRPESLCYCLAYPLELILFACGESEHPSVTLFGLSGWIYMYIAHILASLAVMLLWSKKFKYLIHISTSVLVLSYIPMLFLPDTYLRLAFAAAAYTGLGGAVTSARCGFAFAANNAERFIGMVFMFLSVAVIYFLDALNIDSIAFTHILPLLILAALAFCLLKFKEDDLEVREEYSQNDAKGLYCALAYMIAFFAIDGYNWSLIDTGYQHGYILTCIGMVTAGGIFVAVVVFFKKSVWHVWNMFFAFAIIMAVLANIAPETGRYEGQHFFCGLTLIGWPASLYMLSCAQRRFASYTLLKKCTVIFVILSPITTLSDDIVSSLFPEAVPAVTLVFVLVIVIGFLMASPLSYKYLFSAVWLADLHKNDMTINPNQVSIVSRIERFRLTNREKEITSLLLSAMTMRMISGELHISESTVKMHTSNIYKKLGIRSRIELFRRFGVPEIPEETPIEDETSSLN